MAKKRASIKEILAVNLKETRRKKGLTQEQFAELANISLRYIAMLELGKSFPSGEMLEKLAQALNIQTYQLFTPTATPEGALLHLEQNIIDNIGTVISQTIKHTLVEETVNPKPSKLTHSPPSELEQFKQDILKEINKTVTKAVKETYSKDIKKDKK